MSIEMIDELITDLEIENEAIVGSLKTKQAVRMLVLAVKLKEILTDYLIKIKV